MIFVSPQPDFSSVEPCHDLPFSITKLRSFLCSRVGSHALLVEQGWQPCLPRHLCRCTFSTTQAGGDEGHCLFDCLRFDHLRLEHAQLFDEARGAMCCLMWRENQKSVCATTLAKDALDMMTGSSS